MNDLEPIDDVRLFRVREVADRIGCSIRQVWSLCASHRLPPPVYVGRSARWRAQDLREWIADLSTESLSPRPPAGRATYMPPEGPKRGRPRLSAAIPKKAGRRRGRPVSSG